MSNHSPQFEVDHEQLDRYLLDLQDEQNFGTAIVGGLSWAIVGASLWSIVAAVSGGPATYMAVPLGFLVGHGVRITGRGLQPRFGLLGAGIALLGCLVGHGLAVAVLRVHMARGPLWSELGDLFLHPLRIGGSLAEFFHPLDLLFYGLAIFQGYRFAIKRIREEELIQFVRPVRRRSNPPMA